VSNLPGSFPVDVERLVALSMQMVSVDTRNPPGNETPIEGVIRSALQGWNPRWTRIEPAPGRLSLVAEIPHPDGPDPSRKTLIVNGHLDVVPVNAPAWTSDPFTPQVVDGKLFGRGSADMKGGIAAAIAALDTLERSGRAPGANIVFHLVADEERGGGLGTKVLLDMGLIAGDACLIPEPTDLAVCVAERGLLQGRITVAGKPAHGSRPREGVSAIEHAARVVLALHGADFAGPTHPLLGAPSANIGIINGGSAFNTVAESCVVGVDRRLLPGATASSATSEIVAMIDGAAVQDLRYTFEVDTFGEASEMPAEDPFATLVRSCVASVTGSEPDIIGMTFTTDARFVRNQAGIPAVVCGPGAIDQAHGDDEYVTVERLAQACEAFARLYAEFS